MAHSNFVLSTCGTALLTNPLNQLERKKVNRYSNIKRIDEIPQEDRDWFLNLLAQRNGEFLDAKLSDVIKMSAEMNGLIKFYGGTIERNHDYHLLLCTDTWLGEQVAKIEAEWLRKFCMNVEVRRQQDLQTAELDPFQLALSDITQVATH